ncbi:Uu.00g056450.m01.CDS01 [Anthostomella pinea]|uniref:Uu.00g056450.m01.CDS01 n=1 Tax=Anthostomella pinea TaxID=933095 RepID=A0AAI8VKY6_9PEZI|nr:Uu.00g056450.m01.CDS01 [Anthostomella pinea]
MYPSFIAVLTALTATIAAFPHTTRNAALGSATNFIEGCSPGGCIASFNITAPAGYVAGAPAYNVVCHPIYIQQGWLTCDAVGEQAAGSTVQSMWTGASERELIKISVAHLFVDGETGAAKNASGFAEIEAGTTAFDVPVTSLTAVL